MSAGNICIKNHIVDINNFNCMMHPNLLRGGDINSRGERQREMS